MSKALPRERLQVFFVYIFRNCHSRESRKTLERVSVSESIRRPPIALGFGLRTQRGYGAAAGGLRKGRGLALSCPWGAVLYSPWYLASEPRCLTPACLGPFW